MILSLEKLIIWREKNQLEVELKALEKEKDKASKTRLVEVGVYS